MFGSYYGLVSVMPMVMVSAEKNETPTSGTDSIEAKVDMVSTEPKKSKPITIEAKVQQGLPNDSYVFKIRPGADWPVGERFIVSSAVMSYGETTDGTPASHNAILQKAKDENAYELRFLQGLTDSKISKMGAPSLNIFTGSGDNKYTLPITSTSLGLLGGEYSALSVGNVTVTTVPVLGGTGDAVKDDLSEKCADSFKQNKGWVGGTIGRVFCWLGSAFGYVLKQGITQVFDIENIIKSHEGYSKLDGTHIGVKGETIGTQWVLTIWNMLIKLTDIIAVLILIIVAFANILHININVYTVKRLLPTFIGALVGAHLSFFIVRALFTFSSAMVPVSFIGEIEKGIGDLSDGVGLVLGVMFVGFIVQPLLVLLPLLVFFAVVLLLYLCGIMLMLQPAIVSILTMFAPIMVMCVALPQTRAFFDKWLRILMNWIFMWPLTMFLLFIISKIVSSTDLAGVLRSLADAIWPSSGEGATESMLSVFVAASPLLVALILFGLAVRIPFMLGKDVMAIANSAKQGLQSLTDMSKATIGKAAGAAQIAAEKGKGMYERGSNLRDKNARASLLRGVNAASTPAAKTKYLRDEAMKKGRGARIAASLLREEEARGRAQFQQGEEAKTAMAIDMIRQSSLTHTDKKKAIADEKRKLDEALYKKSSTTREDLEEYITQHPEIAKSATAHNMTVAEFMSSQDKTVVSERGNAEVIAARAWQKNRSLPRGTGLKLINEIRQFRTLGDGPKPWEYAIVQGELQPKVGTGAEAGLQRQLMGLQNQGIGIANIAARYLLNPVRTASILENAQDTAKQREEHLKKLRRETYLGTGIFERLAGPQVAGQTVAGEYAEKYRFWQYPELLQEVRRLRKNLSAQQLAQIIQQSPRKAWPMATSMGYSNLDDFAKLYMASNYMKSAGRSRGARATFEEMLTTGRTAGEIESRQGRSMPAEGGFGPASLPAQGSLGNNPPDIQTVKLQNQSAKLLSALLGAGVGEATAREMVTVLGPHLGKVQPEQYEALERIRSDSSLTSDSRIARMITELRGVSSGVGSMDISMSLTSTGSAERAYQSYKKSQGVEMSIEQARQELQERSLEAMNKKVGIVPPPSATEK